MTETKLHTLHMTERIKSKKLIDRLFEKESTSIVAFPFRVVYLKVEKSSAPVSILISVPKKRFHHAVDRNRIKRQVREAFRLQKQTLINQMADADFSFVIGFICISSQHSTTATVEKSMKKTLSHISSLL